MPVSRMAECATSGRIAHKVRHLTIMIDHMSQREGAVGRGPLPGVRDPAAGAKLSEISAEKGRVANHVVNMII